MVEVEHTIETSSEDYTHSAVPLQERRDPFTMGLLWITMVTGFPSVLAGFEWYKQGISFWQVISLALVSCGVLLVYSIPACLLGARSGLTYALLSRKVFGRWGSRLVSFNLCWISLSWYGLTAVWMAEGLIDICHLKAPLAWLSVGFAVIMAFNNFFGFAGVANFARYAAGPILIVWVLSAFGKAAGTCPATVLHESGRASMMSALTIISAFTIGYASWGNEADYWRFGQPKKRHIVIPLLVALLIGEILFPITGWMLGRMGGDHTSASSLMANFAFGGIPAISALVLFVTYFAVNDSTLYGSINALENVAPLPRRLAVSGLTFVGSLAAFFLSGLAHNFECVASVSCIVLPSATTIILAEVWGLSPEKLSHVPRFSDLPPVRWPAVIALAVGSAVGIASAVAQFGVPALQAWLTSLVTYLLLRRLDRYTRQLQPTTDDSDDKSSSGADAACGRIQSQTAE